MNKDEDVIELFKKWSHLLNAEGRTEVKFYLDHDEYEMAFEGMVIELMEANTKPVDFNPEYWLTLGRALGLHEESVFDGNFWSRFEKWVKSE